MGALSDKIAEFNADIFEKNPNVVAVVRRSGESRASAKARLKGYSEEAISALSGKGPFAGALAVALQKERDAEREARDDERFEWQRQQAEIDNQRHQANFESSIAEAALRREAYRMQQAEAFAARERAPKIAATVSALTVAKTPMEVQSIVERISASGEHDVLADSLVQQRIQQRAFEFTSAAKTASMVGVDLAKIMSKTIGDIANIGRRPTRKEEIATAKAELDYKKALREEHTEIEKKAYAGGVFNPGYRDELNNLKAKLGMELVDERGGVIKTEKATPSEPPRAATVMPERNQMQQSGKKTVDDAKKRIEQLRGS